MSIVDPSSMVLNATVNQVDAEKLRMGMKAPCAWTLIPDLELPATLVGIGAMAKTSAFRASYVRRDSDPAEAGAGGAADDSGPHRQRRDRAGIREAGC